MAVNGLLRFGAARPTVKSAQILIDVAGWLVWPVIVLFAGRAVMVAVTAPRHVTRQVSPEPAGWCLPAVSIVVPAYNEAAGIVACVSSLAASRYPRFDIGVVDDGSTDGTGDIIEGLGLPKVWLLRQANTGKAGALNAGIASCVGEVVVSVDADTIVEPDTLVRLVEVFIDHRVGAAAGNTKVGNRGGVLGRWQHLEYVASYNADRRVYDVLGCMPTVPGAVGAFRRRALAQVGGFSDETMAEDTDVTMAIGRAGWAVAYRDRARAWTEAPADLRSLWRQRKRWVGGTYRCMWKHRGSIRQRCPLGGRGLPIMIAYQVVLPLIAPAVDVYAFSGLLAGQPGRLFGLAAVTVTQLALAAYVLHLDGEDLRPLCTLPLQQFVHRSLTLAVAVRALLGVPRGQIRWERTPRAGNTAVGGGLPGR